MAVRTIQEADVHDCFADVNARSVLCAAINVPKDAVLRTPSRPPTMQKAPAKCKSKKKLKNRSTDITFTVS